MSATPKSLVLDLLSTMRGGSMPVGLIVEASGPFGFDPGAVRTALARLRARGMVESDERGHYRLGPEAVSTDTRVRGWRRLDKATVAWRGDWNLVHTAAIPKSDRTSHRRTQHALNLFSLRELSAGLFARPANLKLEGTTLASELSALGLDRRAVCIESASLDPASDKRARGLWENDGLEAAYRDSLAALARSTERLPTLPADEGMVESFFVGGNILRTLVLDPLLPDEIAPGDDRRALIAAMRDYDRLGRSIWAPLMRRYDIDYQSSLGRLGTVGSTGSIGEHHKELH